MGPCDRGGRDRAAGPDLRPALDFRLGRARAGVGIHALARIMGTSVRMIEKHYGAMLDGAVEEIAGRLDALDHARDEVADDRLGR